MLESKEMRAVYCECLMELADKDDRIVVLDADLMRVTGTLPFKEKYPERSINVGVAEANLIGVSAGLAVSGKIPFANSFTAFATRRCYDQIAVSVAYARLNVKICGFDPGIAAELNGGTHMCFEDVGIMRTLPTMTIFEPVDSVQLRKAMPQIVAHPGPVYIRLFRRVAESVFDESFEFKLGKAHVLRPGKDAVIFATGMMVHNSILAATVLANEGLDVQVVNIHTVKPLDKGAIIEAARTTGAVVTAENHNIINGLGSAVAEVLVENCPVPLQRVGVKDEFGEVGKKDYLMQRFGLNPEDIAAAVRTAVRRKQSSTLLKEG